MAFWDTAFQYFWREESLLVLVMMLGLAFLLLHFHKAERNSIINTLGFFLACLLGQFLSGLIHAMQFEMAANVLHEAFVIGGGIALIRLWGLLVFRIVLPLLRMTPPRITEDIFVIIAYIAWGLVRLRYAGLDLGSIVATSAMITAVVAFAMQDTLGNILGGLALQLDNSIQIGDWIKVDDITGRVVDIRWRSTLVETRNWETVVFPNSQLMKNKFMVLGRRTDQPVQLRRWVWFNVSLEIAPPRVIGLVEEAVQHTDIANVALTMSASRSIFFQCFNCPSIHAEAIPVSRMAMAIRMEVVRKSALGSVLVISARVRKANAIPLVVTAHECPTAEDATAIAARPHGAQPRAVALRPAWLRRAACRSCAAAGCPTAPGRRRRCPR